jgi:hypothetical protein
MENDRMKIYARLLLIGALSLMTKQCLADVYSDVYNRTTAAIEASYDPAFWYPRYDALVEKIKTLPRNAKTDAIDGEIQAIEDSNVIY